MSFCDKTVTDRAVRGSLMPGPGYLLPGPGSQSRQTARSHGSFVCEYDLAFPLLSDDTGTVSDTDWTVRYAWAAENPQEFRPTV